MARMSKFSIRKFIKEHQTLKHSWKRISVKFKITQEWLPLKNCTSNIEVVGVFAETHWWLICLEMWFFAFSPVKKINWRLLAMWLVWSSFDVTAFTQSTTPMQIMRPMNKRDKINQIVKGTRNEFKELLEKDLGVWLKIVFGAFFLPSDWVQCLVYKYHRSTVQARF